MFARNILIVLALVLAAQMPPGKSTQRFEHPGTIVDASDGRGIKADATAYPSRKRVSYEACPVYEGDHLDAQRSRASDGTFAFRIDSSKTTYVAVYCQGGYQQFTNEINDNSHDGKRIEPDPVELYPVASTIATRKLDPNLVALSVIVRQLDRATVKLQYFSKADERAFYEALKRMPEADQKIVSSLVARRLPTEYAPSDVFYPRQ